MLWQCCRGRRRARYSHPEENLHPTPEQIVDRGSRRRAACPAVAWGLSRAASGLVSEHRSAGRFRPVITQQQCSSFVFSRGSPVLRWLELFLNTRREWLTFFAYPENE